MRSVVVTGMGAVHPYGRGVDSLWHAIRGPQSASATISHFDASSYPTTFAASIPDDVRRALPEPDAVDSIRVGLAAVEDALRDAGLDDDALDGRGICAFGFETAAGAFEPVARSLAPGMVDGRMSAERLIEATDGAETPDLDWFNHERFLRGVRGLLPGLERVQIVCAACASGAEALGIGLNSIRSGRADVVVAGAADAKVNAVTLGLIAQLGMTSRRNDDPAGASRPFDRTRDGIVLGEGAGALVLESEEHARRRCARVRARLTGFASTCDAWRLTDPAENGVCAARAIERAREDAGGGPIDYVNAHGTSTLMNDRAEVTALRIAFDGEAMPPVSSTKGATGHLMAAAGAIEAVICVRALEEQEIPPTLNHRDRDPRCDVDVVAGEPRPAHLTRVLSSSFGVGGQNACLVIERGHA